MVRLNKKTTSLVTLDGDRWNVAPELLELREGIKEVIEADDSEPSLVSPDPAEVERQRQLTYLAQGLDKRAVAFFFDAAASCFRAGPWDKVPYERFVISVSIESLGVDQLVVSLLDNATGPGFALHESLDQFNRYTLRTHGCVLAMSGQ